MVLSTIFRVVANGTAKIGIIAVIETKNRIVEAWFDNLIGFKFKWEMRARSRTFGKAL